MGEGHQGTHKSRRQAIRRKVQRRHDGFYKHCSHWSFAGADDGTAQPIRWHRERWIVAATATLMVLLSAVAIPSWANAMKQVLPAPPRIILSLTLPPLPPKTQTRKFASWHTVTIQPGQTLSGIFQAQGLGFSDLQRALAATQSSTALRDVHPGETLAFRIGAQGNLNALRFSPDALHLVTLHFDGASVTRSVKSRTFAKRQRIAHGVIHHSLSGAAAHADMSQAVMVQLTHIFRNEINFSRDIRAGDSFTVIYNAIYQDGTYQHAGNVLAVEFKNGGHLYTAYRFKLPDGHYGYFNKQGRPLQVSLLRTPVKYKYVSSPFGMRKDPITGKYQLHAGVDLAAAKGTPIHAANNGVITIHQWVRGFGRYVCVKMNSVYTTCYAHMSRYVTSQHDGTRVQQGEVIGYVGESGWATGPHLHFSVHVHGKPVNPLTVTLPKPNPLSPTLLAKFEQHTKPLLARIKRINRRVQLARANAHAEPGHTTHAG